MTAKSASFRADLGPAGSPLDKGQAILDNIDSAASRFL